MIDMNYQILHGTLVDALIRPEICIESAQPTWGPICATDRLRHIGDGCRGWNTSIEDIGSGIIKVTERHKPLRSSVYNLAVTNLQIEGLDWWWSWSVTATQKNARYKTRWYTLTHIRSGSQCWTNIKHMLWPTWYLNVRQCRNQS